MRRLTLFFLYITAMTACITSCVDEEEYAEAVRMLKFLRFFRTIEDDSIIVNNSIIREFIGGSIFVDGRTSEAEFRKDRK